MILQLPSWDRQEGVAHLVMGAGVVAQIEKILLPTATTPRGIRFAIRLPNIF